MPRGRKPKVKTEETVAVKVDHAKLLKQFEEEQVIKTEALYKDLANVKHQLSLALTQIGFIDSSETLGEAAFKAGRAYGPLDEANDKLEEILEDMYGNSDFDHYEDILNN